MNIFQYLKRKICGDSQWKVEEQRAVVAACTLAEPQLDSVRAERMVGLLSRFSGHLAAILSGTATFLFGAGRGRKALKKASFVDALGAVQAAFQEGSLSAAALDCGVLRIGGLNCAASGMLLDGDPVEVSRQLALVAPVYGLDCICTQAVADVLAGFPRAAYMLVEIDCVQLFPAGPVRIFWPVLRKQIGVGQEELMKSFSDGLQLYYQGNWPSAYDTFSACSDFPPAAALRDRLRGQVCPRDWQSCWQFPKGKIPA